MSEKQSKLKQLKSAITSQFTDIFQSYTTQARENAKMKHNIDIPKENVKEIVKKAIVANKSLPSKLKGTKAEIQETLIEAYKQAKSAALGETSSNPDDDFFKSLGLDIDDLNEDDWNDIDSGDLESELGLESSMNLERARAEHLGGVDYFDGYYKYKREVIDAGQDDKNDTDDKMRDNDITAALILFINTLEEFKSIYTEYSAEINDLIVGNNDPNYPIPEQDTGDDTNLVSVIDIATSEEEDIPSIPRIGMEDDDTETDVVVIDENPILNMYSPERVYEMTQEKLELIDSLSRSSVNLIAKVEREATPEMKDAYKVWQFKLNKIINFASVINPELDYNDIFEKGLLSMVGLSCDDFKGMELTIAIESIVYFYLGLVPDEIIDLGYRICKAYVDVIELK